ncbi:MAG: hypothetical protein ACLRSF_02765 [Romboutsia timonensis]|uniref:hypothetical protein n=1 Tax=Romboutsia timonensis TaxID=1776391 RepID=UPI0039904658
MIDKYKILNNEKINFSKYDIVNTDDEKMKNIVISKLNSRKKKHKNPFKIAMTSIASIILCVTTVYAGQYISSKINVNNTELPELDPMKVISVNNIDGEVDEETKYYIEKKYSSYKDLSEDIGTSLLNTELASETPYIRINALTSVSKDFLIVDIDNYIIGDTYNFKILDDIDKYSYEHGEEYYSPISLRIEMILSEEQLSTGIDRDYLGMYDFQESYISDKGYKVNIIKGTDGDDSIISEKCAIFVADGIRYTLQGRVTTELLKDIVDSMN